VSEIPEQDQDLLTNPYAYLTRGGVKLDTSAEGIKQHIAQGESDTVEFKTRLPPEHSIATVMTSFANSRGGILIIGVDDSGEITGLSDHEALMAAVKLKEVHSSLFTQPTHVGARQIDGKAIACIIVDKVPPHLSPVTTATGEIYIRRGSATIRLSEANEGAGLPLRMAVPAPTNEPCAIFVAMSFREEEEPALVDYYRAIQRAVERVQLPITLVRMDLVEGDYEISQQLMDEIEKADVVIADFTLSPANVYFELGYARGRGKRIIQMARKDTLLEFDVRNWRTLFYRNATELEEKLIPEVEKSYFGNTSKRQGRQGIHIEPRGD